MQYGIINYSHHAVHYMPGIYLFYSWKFVPFDNLHLFPTTPSSNHQFPLSIYELLFVVVFCLLIFFCFLDTTCKYDCMVFVFLWRTYFRFNISNVLPGGASAVGGRTTLWVTHSIRNLSVLVPWAKRAEWQ